MDRDASEAVMALRSGWRLAAAVALVVSVLLTAPAPSLACSCADGPREVDVAFVGRVVTVVAPPRWLWQLVFERGRLGGRSIAVLAAENVWQGPPLPYFAVVGGNGNAADCSIAFEPGATYIVYALRRGIGPLDTNSCLPTHELEDLAR